MKRKMLAGVLLVAATVTGGYGAWAADMEQSVPGISEGRDRGPCGRMPPGDGLDHLAKMLGLSESQQKQIRDIMETEGEKSAPLREKALEYRRQLLAAEEAASFDEAKVRAIAAKQAQTEIELTVSRARARSRIIGLLTPEQRALEQRIRPPLEPGPGHQPLLPGER